VNVDDRNQAELLAIIKELEEDLETERANAATYLMRAEEAADLLVSVGKLIGTPQCKLRWIEEGVGIERI